MFTLYATAECYCRLMRVGVESFAAASALVDALCKVSEAVETLLEVVLPAADIDVDCDAGYETVAETLRGLGWPEGSDSCLVEVATGRCYWLNDDEVRGSDPWELATGPDGSPYAVADLIDPARVARGGC